MVRLLSRQDIPEALGLSCAAGWNQTSTDWERLLALEPEGCFGIDADGRLAATATLLCHGGELAWVGMVLTRIDCRRRGYARRLVAEALALAERRGAPCVKLDATDQGRDLYRQFGFVDEQAVERWERFRGVSENGRPMECGAPDLALDREAFGADRSRFLASLGDAACFPGGFVMERPGNWARYLGPCVATDPREAEAAIRTVVGSRSDAAWFWDLLPEQREAARIARNLGFAPARRLMRMRRGRTAAGDNLLVYAIGGLEAG